MVLWNHMELLQMMLKDGIPQGDWCVLMYDCWVHDFIFFDLQTYDTQVY